jgi:CNT family concentrative nucleoside transporter
MQTLQSAFGLVVLLALSWTLSEQRRDVPWRLVASGVLLAFVLAAAFLRIPQLSAALAVSIPPW